MKEMLGLLLVLGMLGQSISPAEILDITAEETQARQVEDGLSDAEREISGSLQLDGGYDVRAALLRLWQRLLLLLREKIREETGFAGRLILGENGEPVISFGKHKGKTAREVWENEPSYFAWIEGGDFTLDTKRQFARLKAQFQKERKEALNRPATADELQDLASRFNTGKLF